MPVATVEAARTGMQLVVDAGALAARLTQVDEKHLILASSSRQRENADRLLPKSDGVTVGRAGFWE